MPQLSKAELNEFLNGGPHVMKLATLSSDGWPYVNPVWYHYEGGKFLIAGRGPARWVANIREDQRVSLCIDTSNPPYTRVLVRAVARILDSEWTGDWESWAVHYLGSEAGHRYYEETKHIPRVLIEVTSETIATWAGPGWHPRYNS